MKQTDLLEAVREVALLMGKRALGYFRTAIRSDSKPDGTEVTAADLECESLARSWIMQRFPGDAILGEEHGVLPGRGPRRWLIDPIDGTRSFVRGVPLWGSMIAVEEGGTVLAGAIYCPATSDLVAAARGEGCWHGDHRTQVSSVTDLSRAVILTTDDRFPTNPHRATSWAALAGRVSVSRTWGDCFGYVMVATGRAEVMADDSLHPWDSHALDPIITEAGGILTDWQNRRAPGSDALATNKALESSVRACLGVL